METEKKTEYKNKTGALTFLKELVSMDMVNSTVIGRLRKRMGQLKELSQAKITKVSGSGRIPAFDTKKPKFYLTNLSAQVIGGTGYIEYQIYAMDESGNKKAQVTTAKDSNGREYELDVTYQIDKTVREVISHGKTIKIEELEG